MRRTCTILLLFLLFVYGRMGYRLYLQTEGFPQGLVGTLAAIAADVSMLPLQTGNYAIAANQIEQVRCDGNDLFLLHENCLYHFSRQEGRLLNVWREAEDCGIFTYALDTERRQLALIDRERKVYQLSYDGELLSQSVLPADCSWRSLGSLTYHKGQFWSTVECIDSETQAVEQWLCAFDEAFHPTYHCQLHVASVGRSQLDYCLQPTLGVHEGNLYAYASPPLSDYLLRDTLCLLEQDALEITPDYASILPLQVGQRMLLAQYEKPMGSDEALQNYLFYFDRQSTQAYLTAEGLVDNFYGTGSVASLHPLDATATTYYYTKKGSEIPAYTSSLSPDAPVLFFVHLKG